MAAPDLDQGLGSGQGIGVEFSKKPDLESLRRAFSFVPSLPGRVEMLSDFTAVYIPSRDPEPEAVYSMRITGALKDTEGLKMGDDFLLPFTADIPYLNIVSFESSLDDEIHFSPLSGSVIPITVNTGGIIQCYIRFSLPFETSVQIESAMKISLRPFFPGSLPPVSLRTARWINKDILCLEWEGPEPGYGEVSHYYRLVIPGGNSGVQNGRGSFLKNEFFLILEAVW